MTYVTQLPRVAAHKPQTGFIQKLIQLNTVYQERCELAKLDHTQLRDIGLTSVDIQQELSKSIWSNLRSA